MMDPEASVSALVFHHPDCVYFSVSDEPAETAASQLLLARQDVRF
jgi:hypothetical protein